jgi:hypothetical protein
VPEIYFKHQPIIIPGLNDLINTMDRKLFNYYAHHETKSFPGKKQVITYSFNDHVQTIRGMIEENGDHIYLYEYRGQFIGTEFFISFSKRSASYKLIEVNEEAV